MELHICNPQRQIENCFLCFKRLAIQFPKDKCQCQCLLASGPAFLWCVGRSVWCPKRWELLFGLVNLAGAWLFPKICCDMWWLNLSDMYGSFFVNCGSLTLIMPFVWYVIFTRRYDPLRGPTSSSCGGLQPLAKAFFALSAKKELSMMFWPILGDFWCPVVTVVTFSNNLSNFERTKKQKKNPKKSKFFFNPKIQKIQKSKNPKKIQIIQKKSKNINKKNP